METAGIFILDFPDSRTVIHKFPSFISHIAYGILLEQPELTESVTQSHITSEWQSWALSLVLDLQFLMTLPLLYL